MLQTIVPGNRILDLLPREESEQIRPKLRVHALENGEIVHGAGGLLDGVYFPLTSVLSIVAVMEDGKLIETGAVGRESLSAAAAVLGGDRMLNQIMCQVPGDALRMSIDDFSAALDQWPHFQLLARRSVLPLITAMAQSIACHQLHPLSARCARWLLSTHDRVDGDEFVLTQEFLAMMLGVHRPGVSIAAAALQKAGLITYHRGHMTIVDRAGLEAASCECYRIVANECDRLMTLDSLETPSDGTKKPRIEIRGFRDGRADRI